MPKKHKNHLNLLNFAKKFKKNSKNQQKTSKTLKQFIDSILGVCYYQKAIQFWVAKNLEN